MELRVSEDKTISFEWFMSEDGNEATIVETFVDSANCKSGSGKSFEITRRLGILVNSNQLLVEEHVKKDLIDISNVAKNLFYF